jgi:excinuclease ABC subunit A
VAERHGFDLKQAVAQVVAGGAAAAAARHWRRTVRGGLQEGRSRPRREWRMQVPWKGLARQVEEWFHGKDGENSSDERFARVMRSQSLPRLPRRTAAAGPAAVRVGGVRLPELLAQTVDDAFAATCRAALDANEQAHRRRRDEGTRPPLSFLRETGLGYLTLDRSAATLSGGEAQRIRLATQLGNKLVGVLYVLDEPTVGLHPRDTERLLHTLLELRDLGNTVIAVEHDETMMRAADHVLDMGPGAGTRGGRVVAAARRPPSRRAKASPRSGCAASCALPRPEQRRAAKATWRCAGSPCTTCAASTSTCRSAASSR